MPSQQELDHFTLAFHRLAVARLREDGQLLTQARATLNRWREQRGATRSDTYFDTWHALLDQGADAIEHTTCLDTDLAATLRNVSPLGFVLSPVERAALRQFVKAQHAAVQVAAEPVAVQ